MSCDTLSNGSYNVTFEGSASGSKGGESGSATCKYSGTMNLSNNDGSITLSKSSYLYLTDQEYSGACNSSTCTCSSQIYLKNDYVQFTCNSGSDSQINFCYERNHHPSNQLDSYGSLSDSDSFQCTDKNSDDTGGVKLYIDGLLSISADSLPEDANLSSASNSMTVNVNGKDAKGTMTIDKPHNINIDFLIGGIKGNIWTCPLDTIDNMSPINSQCFLHPVSPGVLTGEDANNDAINAISYDKKDNALIVLQDKKHFYLCDIGVDSCTFLDDYAADKAKYNNNTDTLIIANGSKIYTCAGHDISNCSESIDLNNQGFGNLSSIYIPSNPQSSTIYVGTDKGYILVCTISNDKYSCSKIDEDKHGDSIYQLMTILDEGGNDKLEAVDYHNGAIDLEECGTTSGSDCNSVYEATISQGAGNGENDNKLNPIVSSGDGTSFLLSYMESWSDNGETAYNKVCQANQCSGNYEWKSSDNLIFPNVWVWAKAYNEVINIESDPTDNNSVGPIKLNLCPVQSDLSCDSYKYSTNSYDDTTLNSSTMRMIPWYPSNYIINFNNSLSSQQLSIKDNADDKYYPIDAGESGQISFPINSDCGPTYTITDKYGVFLSGSEIGYVNVSVYMACGENDLSYPIHSISSHVNSSYANQYLIQYVSGSYGSGSENLNSYVYITKKSDTITFQNNTTDNSYIRVWDDTTSQWVNNEYTPSGSNLTASFDLPDGQTELSQQYTIRSYAAIGDSDVDCNDDPDNCNMDGYYKVTVNTDNDGNVTVTDSEVHEMENRPPGCTVTSVDANAVNPTIVVGGTCVRSKCDQAYTFATTPGSHNSALNSCQDYSHDNKYVYADCWKSGEENVRHTRALCTMILNRDESGKFSLSNHNGHLRTGYFL